MKNTHRLLERSHLQLRQRVCLGNNRHHVCTLAKCVHGFNVKRLESRAWPDEVEDDVHTRVVELPPL